MKIKVISNNNYLNYCQLLQLCSYGGVTRVVCVFFAAHMTANIGYYRVARHVIYAERNRTTWIEED